MAILSKACNQIILKYISLALWIFEVFIWILLIANLSLNQTLLTFLLCVKQTWMTQLILAISLRGYLLLIWKDSSTHMYDLAVYVKEGLPFALDVSVENSADSYLCFQLALLHSVVFLFPLSITIFSFVHCFCFYFI